MPPHGGLRVVTAAPPAVCAPGDLAHVAGAADLIELRLDLLRDAAPGVPVGEWVRAAPRPVLATVRSRAQGGAYTGAPRDAAVLLREAARAGAAWLDVEERVAPYLDALPAGVRRLASLHGAAVPDQCFVAPPWADLAKVARPVDTPQDFAALQAEAAAAASGTFVVPYGRLACTRTLFAEGGLLFGSARADAPGAAGQPTLDVLLAELRAGEVTRDAALYGLVGDPPARSPSPAMHNAVFRARALDALYVPLGGLDLDQALGLPVEGLSVTHPHKTRAFELADVLDGTAREVGAVNTLVRRAEGWWGGNTDARGLRAVLPTARPGATAYVHGAGGYARAAAWALRTRGYEVRLGARHPVRGQVAAATCDVAWSGETYARRDRDEVVVNATPAGVDGVSPAAFAGQSLVDLWILDAPYRDAAQPTGLVAQAVRQGAARVLDGRALLRAQALEQAIAFGADPIALDLDRILDLALDPPATWVLLGMRGAGKTHVGRAVAQRLGRPFVDLDKEVERITGCTSASWIRTDGWDAFRVIEREALARALARRGIVLATGGGVVEDAASRALLAGAASCILLDVEPERAAARVQASGVDRPRLPGCADAVDEARRMLERRGPWWRELADVVVDANLDVESVVAAVARCQGQPRPWS